MTDYALPDGFTTTARDTAPAWNGFPVPVLGARDYDALVAHLGADDAEPYSAAYSTAYAAPGYVCDGLQWSEVVDEDTRTPDLYICQDCALKLANDEDPTEPDPEHLPLSRADGEIVLMDLEEGHFSASPCPTCGTALGGDRYPAARF